MKNPFMDENGINHFPYQPIRDIVFVLPDKCPDQLNGLIIPEQYREDYRNEYGIVLAIGPGCYIPKFKKYVPTTVKVNEIVIYDPSTPWLQEIKDQNGNIHTVKVLGERDLSGVLRQ